MKSALSELKAYISAGTLGKPLLSRRLQSKTKTSLLSSITKITACFFLFKKILNVEFTYIEGYLLNMFYAFGYFIHTLFEKAACLMK